MKKNWITPFVAAATLLAASAVYAKDVKTADKDNDGTLDRNEAKSIPLVAEHFDVMDTDKDGTVDQIEIDTFRVMMNDQDKDGTLDKKEVKHEGIAKVFEQLDADNDGTLDANEVRQFFVNKQSVRWVVRKKTLSEESVFFGCRTL